MEKLRAEFEKAKKRRTKSGRVSLCRMVFKAKDWRGEDREVRLCGEKDHCPLMGTGRLSGLSTSSELGALRPAGRPSTDLGQDLRH